MISLISLQYVPYLKNLWFKLSLSFCFKKILQIFNKVPKLLKKYILLRRLSIWLKFIYFERPSLKTTVKNYLVNFSRAIFSFFSLVFALNEWLSSLLWNYFLLAPFWRSYFESDGIILHDCSRDKFFVDCCCFCLINSLQSRGWYPKFSRFFFSEFYDCFFSSTVLRLLASGLFDFGFYTDPRALLLLLCNIYAKVFRLFYLFNTFDFI